jgi:hypothetical protein
MDNRLATGRAKQGFRAKASLSDRMRLQVWRQVGTEGGVTERERRRADGERLRDTEAAPEPRGRQIDDAWRLHRRARATVRHVRAVEPRADALSAGAAARRVDVFAPGAARRPRSVGSEASQ